MSFQHIPVLLSETVAGLSPKDGGVYVDCTLGRGGHTKTLLAAARCHVIGLDKDPEAIRDCRTALAPFSDRFTAVHAPFRSLAQVLDELQVDLVDGIMADLGVSSPQLDDATRGFSFQKAGPLDMRMNTESRKTADFYVNETPEKELANIIYQYARTAVRAIALHRRTIGRTPWNWRMRCGPLVKPTENSSCNTYIPSDSYCCHPNWMS